eukprot:GGOE01043232.1.p1 GENE.GGOE01043232.1~~GGOE01043232.1.p1  ORF type:complete len:617 (+),score=214.56 GGOE01043232.1:56-1906(+)
MGCGASTVAEPPHCSVQQEQLSAEAQYGVSDGNAYNAGLRGFTEVFTAIATPGCSAAIVATPDDGLQVSVWTDQQRLFGATYGRPALAQKRMECQCSWDALFRWLHLPCIQAAVFSGGALKVQAPPSKVLPPLHVPLELEVDEVRQPTHVLRAVLSAMICTFLRLKRSPRDEQYTALELEEFALQGARTEATQHLQWLRRELRPIQEEVERAQQAVGAAKEQVEGVRKWVARLQFISESYDLDVLYPSRPAPFRLHVSQAKRHIPLHVPPNPHALHLLQVKYGVDSDAPDLGPEGSPHDAILQQLGRVDAWDYDVFRLQHSTQGCPLIFTAYELLHRYGLLRHFALDETTVLSFLQVVEAGYHPNHYHNNVHAADVVQCLHYLLGPAGLQESISLQPVDLLAAILSASIHDYDHPGFNNNFHVKTQAYLAILYNDRSVLENHHLASVFELVKNPKYNVFARLPWDVFKDLRDTMTEMVLATDMGMHGQVTQRFKARLTEDRAWDNKADQRLALSVALKMADISNCCRPLKIYSRWSQCITKEFYLQGDAERTLGLAVSPFMDRTKDETDFVPGQVSFMNYIVIPLAEAVSELLPKMRFAVEQCIQNREILSNPPVG